MVNSHQASRGIVLPCLLSLSAVLGCAEAELPAGASAGGGASIGIAEIDAEFALALCAANRCKGQWYSTPTGCADAAKYSPNAVAPIQQVSAGLMKYDGLKARECINAILAMGKTCALSEGSSPAACGQVFTGAVLVGKPCASSAECASSFCNIASDNGSACGICSDLGSAGVACIDNSTCAKGLGCIQGKCAVPNADDAMAGYQCMGEFGCNAGQRCLFAKNSFSVCVTAGELGAACAWGNTPEICKDGLVCGVDAAKGGGIDKPRCVAHGKLGADCAANLGLPSYCEPGLVCLFQMPTSPKDPLVATCGLAKVQGETCLSGFNDCAPGLMCLPDLGAAKSSGKCASPKKEGEACVKLGSMNTDCAPGLYCEGTPALGKREAKPAQCVAHAVQGGSCVFESPDLLT